MAELEMQAFENKLKNTETRKNLLIHQKYLQQKQQAVKSIENETTVNQSKFNELAKNIDLLESQIKQKKQELSEMETYDLDDLFVEDVKESARESEKLKIELEMNRRKIIDLKKKLETSTEELVQTLRKMSAAKKEFDKLKEQHNAEIESGSGDVAKLKAAVDKAAKKVSADLMERYNKIKQRRNDPIAVLKGDRCSGCNMQLPSSVIGSLKGDKIVECDSCGRIIYVLAD